MNCKPGDLAVLISPPEPKHAGLIVTVLRAGRPVLFVPPFQHFSNTPMWWVRASHACLTNTGAMLTEFVLPDASLRPIRPGDISDEEVRDLYAPKVPEAA